MTIRVLKNKRILMGITGGIAAYKCATLCSRLVQTGAKVDVIMTEAARKFIAPLTFRGLTHRSVYTDMWTIPDGENIPHISLADSSDLLLIAPATANTLAKLANGVADNLLLAVALATPAPIIVAPAMETDMWRHPATQANVERLREWGITFVGPAEGRLASGAQGPGRMVEPEVIEAAVRVVLGQKGDLTGRHVVVTGGRTREAFDPVRYITNHSSGKMGHAIAEAARDRGADVTLITSALLLPKILGVEVVQVSSAAEMHQAVLKVMDYADVLVMAAAVADFRPVDVANQKIKKKGEDEGLTLRLARTVDILSDVAQRKSDGSGPKVTVGFAAESENLIRNAKGKLERKKMDFIVANDISATDAGFLVDTNRVTLLGRDGSVDTLPLMSKPAVAEEILDRVVARLHQKRKKTIA